MRRNPVVNVAEQEEAMRAAKGVLVDRLRELRLDPPRQAADHEAQANLNRAWRIMCTEAIAVVQRMRAYP